MDILLSLRSARHIRGVVDAAEARHHDHSGRLAIRASPFFAVNLVVLALIAYVPVISTLLPDLLKR